jgi:hypothetical protein
MCGNRWDPRDTNASVAKSILQAPPNGITLAVALTFAFGLREGAVVTGLAITALPFCLMQLEFWPRICIDVANQNRLTRRTSNQVTTFRRVTLRCADSEAHTKSVRVIVDER